jgi:hypothetical protein
MKKPAAAEAGRAKNAKLRCWLYTDDLLDQQNDFLSLVSQPASRSV